MKLFIILGYLGSGKTTYVNHFLEKLTAGKTALLVNDFAGVDVDGEILAKYTPFTLAGGSMFCSCKSDQFVKIAKEICHGDFDTLVVESSGFSNPYGLEKLIDLINSDVPNKLEIAETITVVDVLAVEKVLVMVHMTKMQVAFADHILLNKCDLATKEDIARVESLLREINPNCTIERTVMAERKDFTPHIVEKVLPQHVFDLKTQKSMIQINLDATFAEVQAFCKSASEFAHRIKGVLDLPDFAGVFQYSFSEFSMKENGGGGNNVLVLLTVAGRSMTKQIETLLLANPIGRLI